MYGHVAVSISLETKPPWKTSFTCAPSPYSSLFSLIHTCYKWRINTVDYNNWNTYNCLGVRLSINTRCKQVTTWVSLATHKFLTGPARHNLSLVINYPCATLGRLVIRAYVRSSLIRATRIFLFPHLKTLSLPNGATVLRRDTRKHFCLLNLDIYTWPSKFRWQTFNLN